jgi:hypothetical protein
MGPALTDSTTPSPINADADEDRRQKAYLAYFQLAHDTHKHLTTLNAGFIVLIATFFKGHLSEN